MRKRIDKRKPGCFAGGAAALARRAAALLLALCVSAGFMGPASAETGTGYSDVALTAWYAGPVSYAAANGIACGYNGCFRPEDSVTRGEFAVMLVKIVAAADFAEALPENPFADVAEDSFYRDAVLWAYSKGITRGTTEDCFSPTDPIEREDMALMLYRAQELPELGMLPVTTAEHAFQDADQIADYARDAVRTLQTQGLLAGDPAGCCNPRSKLTRAEAVTVLMRVHCFKTGHSHSYQKAGAVAPGCESWGIQSYRCSCGSFYGVKEQAPLGHSYKAVRDPGTWSMVYTCTRCGNSYSVRLPYERIYDGNAAISYENALAVVDQLQVIYPDLISSYTCGSSYYGTPIRAVTFGKGKRYVFMNANIHAKEVVTTNYLLKVLDEYAYAYVTDGSVGSYRIRPLLDSFTIVMIPSSNPDGRARALAGNNCYTNARGVNLNANFPTNWEYDESGESGTSAASEPETQALLSVLRAYPFEVVLDCHTTGNVIYYADPDCSTDLTNRSYRLAAAMKAESGFTLYTYRASAGLANYARHPMNVPGLTVEMYPYSNGLLDCTRFSEWCWSRLDTMPAIVMNWLKQN